jgi:hypothetical protein
MKIYYTATAKFSQTTHRTWKGYDLNWHGYISGSNLRHVKEVITLDSTLGEMVVERDNHLDAHFLVWFLIYIRV